MCVSPVVSSDFSFSLNVTRKVFQTTSLWPLSLGLTTFSSKERERLHVFLKVLTGQQRPLPKKLLDRDAGGDGTEERTRKKSSLEIIRTYYHNIY